MRQSNWLGNFSLLDRVSFSDAPGTVKFIRLQRPCNFLMVSVTQGSVDVWLGEYSGGLPATPHLHFGQTNAPVWCPLPANICDFTIQGNGQTGLSRTLATVFVGMIE